MGLYDDEVKRIALENKVLYKFYNQVIEILDNDLSNKKKISEIMYYKNMIEDQLGEQKNNL